MLKNKKGFTLIELIIVVAIMAVLVALLAPNVLKYLEKSRVSKDLASLDSVKVGLSAELMDEKLVGYTTDGDANKVQGVFLADLEAKAADSQEGMLKTALEGVIDDALFGNEAMASKAGKDAYIMIFVDKTGGVAVAAVNKNKDDKVTIAKAEDGTYLVVATNISGFDAADPMTTLDPGSTLPTPPTPPTGGEGAGEGA